MSHAKTNDEKMEKSETKQPPPLTPAERQRRSRIARKTQTFETFPPKQISFLLSGEASQALAMLSRDMSQKAVIEKLLINAYRQSRL